MSEGYVKFVQKYKHDNDCYPDGLDIWNAGTLFMEEYYKSVPKYLINIIHKIDEAIITAQNNNSEDLKGLKIARNIIRHETRL